ncbi:cytochrome c-type biogenesis protein [Ideonella sp.]|uniref:cytochrome c-type biogenesis protein n=1 Tax=Ideonella sp. TaxID=1929293 RepID=UPI003BB53EC8
MAESPTLRRRPAWVGRLALSSALALSGLTALTSGLAITLSLSPPAQAAEARSVADDPVLEQRMLQVASELRCVVCQNQTVADSHAELASDLRQQIRDQLAAGRNEDQIRTFMTERYGDFVLYRPPFGPRTALLWLGPLLLLLGSLGGLVWVLRRRSRLPDHAFDPDDSPELPGT